jgi:hypothetical protein
MWVINFPFLSFLPFPPSLFLLFLPPLSIPPFFSQWQCNHKSWNASERETRTPNSTSSAATTTGCSPPRARGRTSPQRTSPSSCTLPTTANRPRLALRPLGCTFVARRGLSEYVETRGKRWEGREEGRERDRLPSVPFLAPQTGQSSRCARSGVHMWLVGVVV